MTKYGITQDGRRIETSKDHLKPEFTEITELEYQIAGIFRFYTPEEIGKALEHLKTITELEKKINYAIYFSNQGLSPYA